jgi:AcrR family transcriptional regulator
MGRRSAHTAAELRELILTAAESIIERDGLVGLSARSIARSIAYSPGTLYNIFDNLDDLVLHVEARVLDALDRELGKVAQHGTPVERVQRMARAYQAFTSTHPKLWNLLFEHHLPAGIAVPAWYQQKLDRLMGHLEAAIAPVTDAADPAACRRAARVLWAGVHGITSLATADKHVGIGADAAQAMIDDLVTIYIRGLALRPGPT